jgi:hypothetical protein
VRLPYSLSLLASWLTTSACGRFALAIRLIEARHAVTKFNAYDVIASEPILGLASALSIVSAI